MNRSNVSKVLALAAILAAFPAVASPGAATPQMPQMFLENVGGQDLEKTLAAFEAEVKAANWSILHVHDMAKILSAKGYDLQPIKIFEVCSGKYSAKILTNDADRYVSSLVPCRVAVYRKTNGDVVISRMNAPALSAMLTPSVAEVVNASAREMESIIEKTLAKVR